LRHSPGEWIRLGLSELERARAALAAHDLAAGITGLKRAAGMALNGALVVQPNDAWGRTYVEHLAALANERSAPEAARQAARALTEARVPSGPIVSLRRPSDEERLVEAARTVMAHAYALVHGSSAKSEEG
jgi:HEPN domain-containing protein